jgi:hypothetical protein
LRSHAEARAEDIAEGALPILENGATHFLLRRQRGGMRLRTRAADQGGSECGDLRKPGPIHSPALK